MFVVSSKRVRSFGKWTLIIGLLAALSGCSSTAERKAVCDRSAGLENELLVVGQSVDRFVNARRGCGIAAFYG